MRILRLETSCKGVVTQQIIVELADDGALVLTGDGPSLAADVVKLAQEMVAIRSGIADRAPKTADPRHDDAWDAAERWNRMCPPGTEVTIDGHMPKGPGVTIGVAWVQRGQAVVHVAHVDLPVAISRLMPSHTPPVVQQLIEMHGASRNGAPVLVATGSPRAFVVVAADRQESAPPLPSGEDSQTPAQDQQEPAQQPIDTTEDVPVRHSATDLLSAKTDEAAAIYHPAEPLTDTTKANLFAEAWKLWPVHKKRDRAEKGFMASVVTLGDAALFAQVMSRVLEAWGEAGALEKDAPSYTFFATWRERAAEFGAFAAVAEQGGTIEPDDDALADPVQITEQDIADAVESVASQVEGRYTEKAMLAVPRTMAAAELMKKAGTGGSAGPNRMQCAWSPKGLRVGAYTHVDNSGLLLSWVDVAHRMIAAAEARGPEPEGAGPLADDDDAPFGGPEPEPLQRPNPFRIEFVPSYIPQKVKPFRVVERVGVGTASPKSENRDHFDTVEEALAKYPGASCAPETHAMSARLARERASKKNAKEIGLAGASASGPWRYSLLVDGIPEGDSFDYLDDAIAHNPGVLVNQSARTIAVRDGRVSRPKIAAPAPPVPDGPDSEDDVCHCGHMRADHDDDGGPCLYSAGKHCAGFSLETRAVTKDAMTQEPSEVIDVNHMGSHGQHFGFYDREEWPTALKWPPSENVALPRGTPPPLRAYVTLGEAITAHRGATVTKAATARASEIDAAGPDQRIDWSEADGGFVLERDDMSGWKAAGTFSFLNAARQMHPGVRVTERAKAEASANRLWDAPSA